jgi:hypothetical protein
MNIMKETTRKKSSFRARRGQAMILTVLALGGMMLGATTIAGLLLTYQIRQATDLAASSRAIYAADAGLELALYQFFRNPNEPAPAFLNGAAVAVTCYDNGGGAVPCGNENNYTVRAKGTFGAVNRAFELTLQR